MIQLKNTPSRLKHQHQIFVESLTAGHTQRSAYLQAYPTASEATAQTQSSRLLNRPDITEALARLRQQTEAAAVMTLYEKRAYLARIVRTSATDLTPGETLVQAVSTAKDGTQTLRMPDKLRAIFLDSRLAGELPPLNKPQPTPSPESTRPAHEAILAQALKSICFGTPPPPTAAPPPAKPEPAPASFPPLWPPRPPAASTPKITAPSPPAAPPKTSLPPPPAPTKPASSSPSPALKSPPPELCGPPPPFLPTIRRLHIRLGRRPRPAPDQNLGGISLSPPHSPTPPP